MQQYSWWRNYAGMRERGGVTNPGIVYTRPYMDFFHVSHVTHMVEIQYEKL